MSERAGTKEKSESIYWIGRHKKGFWGSVAALSIGVTGLFGWVGHNRSVDTANEGLAALRQDRACERVIDQKAGPQASTATVRLGALTTQQRVDCRVDSLTSVTDVGRGYGHPGLDATVVDATVKLPSRQQLQAAQEDDLKDSQTSEWSDLPFDIGFGMGLVPIAALAFTALFSGDLDTFNNRPIAPHREQTTTSA